MHDLLEQLMLDPGSRTFGELVQERVWAAQEIRRLRFELAKLRELPARRPGRPALDPRGDAITSTDGAPLRLIRLPELNQLIGVSRSTIYLMMKQDRFPEAVHFKRAAAWRLADVMAWQQTLRSGSD